jgi:hypothetical protein
MVATQQPEEPVIRAGANGEAAQDDFQSLAARYAHLRLSRALGRTDGAPARPWAHRPWSAARGDGDMRAEVFSKRALNPWKLSSRP